MDRLYKIYANKKIDMINTIIRDYRKKTQNSWDDANINYNLLELDSEVSEFLEQLQNWYNDDQILELYNLI